MELIRGVHHLRPQHRGSVVTIGNFDGIHRGHQQLLNELRKEANALELPSVVITFEPQPNEYFFEGKVPPRLMTLREKLRTFQNEHIDRVLCLKFNDDLAALSADDFVEKVLVAGLGVRCLIVGDDFRFGHLRAGDSAFLKNAGERFGFKVRGAETFKIDGKRVSSTRVREALEQGQLKKAEKLLGYPFGLSGRVAHGDKRGRIIGFPTANIYLHRKAVPIGGVYAVRAYGVGQQPLTGVANVGTRPTVDGTRCLLEVHLFDFNETIYGAHIYVEFVHKLRDEKRFASFELLKQQIFKDAEEAQEFFDTVSVK